MGGNDWPFSKTSTVSFGERRDSAHSFGITHFFRKMKSCTRDSAGMRVCALLLSLVEHSLLRAYASVDHQKCG